MCLQLFGVETQGRSMLLDESFENQSFSLHMFLINPYLHPKFISNIPHKWMEQICLLACGEEKLENQRLVRVMWLARKTT